MTIQKWVQEATRPILLRKDRKQAAQELADHFEDHCSALTAHGKSPEQAAQEALAAMGDAKETGLLLRQAYQPVLSVLWRISQAVLCLFGMLLVISLMQSTPYSITPDSFSEAEFNREQLSNPSFAVMQMSDSDEIRVGGYHISVEYAYILPQDGKTSDSIESSFRILIRLRFDHSRQLSTAQNPMYYMTAADDRGNIYLNRRALTAARTHSYLGASVTSITRSQDFLDVTVIGAQSSTSAFPRHIDLIYDHAGCAFIIGIDFSEVTP